MLRFLTLFSFLLSTPIFAANKIKVEGVHRYHCIKGGKYFNFSYPDSNNPPAIPGTQSSKIQCHDTRRFGPVDSPLFPRLGEVKNDHRVWSNADPLFLDSDANAVLDVNDEIAAIMQDRFNIHVPNPLFFTSLDARATPTDYGVSSTPRLGYVLVPFYNRKSKKLFCPDQYHLASDAPIFKVLSEYIVSTEALYHVKSLEGEDDELFLTGTLLRRIGKQQNGIVKLYLPADFKDPYTKKPHQRVYKTTRESLIGCVPR